MSNSDDTQATARPAYEAVAYSDHLDDRIVEVHYNPDHPEENTTGPIAQPWIVLAVAMAIGMPLALLGCYFRLELLRA